MSVDAAVATAVAETESAPTPKPRRRRKRSATKDQIKSAQTPLEKISKFHALCDANLVELEEEVRILTNGLISGNSVFLCGAPGCLHADTPIYDPVDGTTQTVYRRYLAAKPFHVYSHDDNGNVVIKKADRPYKYDAADMITFTMDDGKELTVTHGHKFWNGSSYIEASAVAQQLESGHVLLPTIEDTCLSTQTSDDRRLTRTTEDSQDDCQTRHHSYGEQPLPEAGIDQSSSPSQGDAHAHSHALSHKGDQEMKGTRTSCQSSGHHSSLDYSSQTEQTTGPEWEHYDPSESVSASSYYSPSHGSQSQDSQLPCTSQRPDQSSPVAIEDGVTCSLLSTPGDSSVDTQLQTESHQQSLQSPSGSCQTCTDASALQDKGFSSSVSPVSGLPKMNSTMTRLVSARPAGTHEYYDFCVPETHNYWCMGSFHHNTAKSLMCDAISTLIGGRSYRKLMSKYTDVMELMGPFCPDALKRGVYEIKTDGYLPDADVAFLDEIWKSSSAILNTLLEIINEGTFTNGNQRIQVPLKLVVAASNEYPSMNTGSPLMAMYDRFVLRKNVEPVTKVRGIKKIAFNVIDLTVAEEDKISVDDLDVLRKTCATLPWSAEAKKQFGSAVGDCMKEGIEPSARRIKRAVSSCAADALIKGKSEVSASDLGILQHILWVDPDPKIRAKVADIVGDLGDPAEREAREIEKTYSGLISKIQSASDNGEQLNLILDATKETSDLVNRALTLGLTEQAEHMKTSMAKIREEAFEKV